MPNFTLCEPVTNDADPTVRCPAAIVDVVRGVLTAGVGQPRRIELAVRQVSRKADARLVVDRDVIEGRRIARFEQPPARQRVRVLRLSNRVVAGARVAVRSCARI
jgi:hypothetical protein